MHIHLKACECQPHLSVQVHELKRQTEADQMVKAALVQRYDNNSSSLEMARDQMASMAKHSKALVAEITGWQDAYNHHPAVVQLQEERAARLAMEASYQTVLRALIPHEQHAASEHAWRERVMQQATDAAAGVAAQQAVLQVQASALQVQGENLKEEKESLHLEKHGAAVAELQVCHCDGHLSDLPAPGTLGCTTRVATICARCLCNRHAMVMPIARAGVKIRDWVQLGLAFAQEQRAAEEQQKMRDKLAAIKERVAAEAEAAEEARRAHGLLERQVAKLSQELAQEKEARLRAEKVMVEMQSRKEGSAKVCLRAADGTCHEMHWTLCMSNSVMLQLGAHA